MLSRILRVINVSIAVLVVLLAIAVYWYAYRPLPEVSGQITAPVSAVAAIRRDARGIPHIEAGSWQDAIFLQGFATAQDRLWQMDSLRRYGAGELSEVLGRATLALDERSRTMRMREIAENDLKFLSSQDRAVLVEYARGINYYIHSHRGKYPFPFNIPGHEYAPRPWTIVDSLIVGLVMYRDLTDNSDFEFNKGLLLIQGADEAKVRTLFPAIQGGYINPGSNAWAVSGSHAARGAPMLANDPHLRYTIPSTWHLVHLKAPGLDVSGAALPGVPCIISGHNSQIAWGVTSLSADVMDLYAEQMDEGRGTYVYQGKLEQAQLDRQMIGVRGEAPVQWNTWVVARHGPVLVHANGRTYTMRWSAAEGFGFPFFDIDRATNWQEFRKALSRFWGPGQNFVYADRAGNIGYQAAGSVPIRKDFFGDVPLDGASGKFEWSGYIPFDAMPSAYNPPGGIVASANQNPFPSGFPYQVGGSFDDTYRINQIRSRLAAKPKLSVTDMLAIQKDVFSTFDLFLARQAIAATSKYGPRNDLEREAIQILRDWNGQMDKDQAAPTITQLLRDQMSISLVTSLLPGGLESAVKTELTAQPQNTAQRSGKPGASAYRRNPVSTAGVPNIVPRPQVLQMLLTKRPRGWFSGDNWDAWVVAQFSQALERGRNRLGSPVSKWKWGRVLEWNLEHPIGKEIPVANRFFDIGTVPMSGCGTCVKQTTGGLGPSERMVVDLGDLDNSVQNLTVGESGDVASSHYRDQWPAYYNGTSFPMEFNHVDARDVLTIKPQK